MIGTKHILRNFRIFLSIRIQLLNAYVRTRLTYGCSAWSVSKQQLQEIDTCYKCILRKMIRNGLKQTKDYKYIITDKKLHSICKTTNVSDFIKLQQSKYLAHIIRKPDCATTKIFDVRKINHKKKEADQAIHFRKMYANTITWASNNSRRQQ